MPSPLEVKFHDSKKDHKCVLHICSSITSHNAYNLVWWFVVHCWIGLLPIIPQVDQERALEPYKNKTMHT